MLVGVLVMICVAAVVVGLPVYLLVHRWSSRTRHRALQRSRTRRGS